MTKYRAKQSVTAVQWKSADTKDETNIEEFGPLLADIVGWNEYAGPEIYVTYIEPYFLTTGPGGGYFILQFYAGDDMEVDPGQWVVVYEDGEVEIMNDEQFNKMFEKDNA